MIYPKTQQVQSLNLHDYRNRVIVAGTRGYNNRKEFHEILVEFISNFDAPILFISGAAPTGADRLIIEWCDKFKYPCLQFPADWSLGKSAGYKRNYEMSLVSSQLLAFHNGSSPGTMNMIDLMMRANMPVKVIKI